MATGISEYQSSNDQYSFSKGPKSIYHGRGDENLFTVVLNVPQTDDDDEWGGTQRIADERISDEIAKLILAIAGPTGSYTPTGQGLYKDIADLKGYLDITVPQLELGDIIVNGSTNKISLGSTASLTSSALTLDNEFTIDSTLTRGLIEFGQCSLRLFDEESGDKYVDIKVQGSRFLFKKDLFEVDAGVTTTFKGDVSIEGDIDLSGAISFEGDLTGDTLTLENASIDLAGKITGTSLTVGNGAVTCGPLNVLSGGIAVVTGGLTVSAGTTAISGAVNIGGATKITNSLTIGSTPGKTVEITNAIVRAADSAAADVKSEIENNLIKMTAPSKETNIQAGELYVSAGLSPVVSISESYGINMVNDKTITVQKDAFNYINIKGEKLSVRDNSNNLNEIGADLIKMTAPSKETNIQAGALYVSAGLSPVVSISESYGINMVNDKTITVQKDALNYINITGEKLSVQNDSFDLNEIGAGLINLTTNSGHSIVIGSGEIEISHATADNRKITLGRYGLSCYEGSSIRAVISNSGIDLYQGQDIKLNSYGTGSQRDKEIRLANDIIRAENTNDVYTEIDYNSVYIRNNTGTLISNMIAGAIQFSSGSPADTLSMNSNGLGIQPGTGTKEVTLTIDTLAVKNSSSQYAELKYSSLEVINNAGSPDLSSRIGAGVLEIKQNTSIVHQMNNSILYTSVSDVRFPNLPTSDSGLLTGQLYRDGTDVKVKT